MKLDGVNMISCGRNNCYVIMGKKGDMLIDTATPQYRNEIEMWLTNYNVKLIVITHGHNDHIGNAAYFADLLGAKIAMSEEDISLAEDNLSRHIYPVGVFGKIMKKITLAHSKNNFAVLFNVNIPLEDGTVLGEELGITDCKAVRLDGHTKGSFGILHGKDLYIGDAAMNFIEPSFPAICESPKAARRSLDRVKEISPERIFFGHGDPIEGSGSKYRNMFIKKIL